ncbi:MAG TPA: hypothetical protein VM686_40535 [Polyangiaceae bacterium]|nr:hypothetical protein [Polyangiaceae bacterium]
MTEPKTGLAALKALAAETRAPDPLPRQQLDTGARHNKLSLQDSQEEGGGLGCITGAACFVGGIGWLILASNGWPQIGVPLLVVVTVALFFFHQRGQRMQRDRETRLASALGETPYPVSGVIDWLCADEPILDVTLNAPLEPQLLEDALRALDGTAAVSWPEPTRARVVLSPRELRPARGKWPAVVGGDLALLRQVLTRVLDPVHAELGVARVELGGRVRRDRAR